MANASSIEVERKWLRAFASIQTSAQKHSIQSRRSMQIAQAQLQGYRNFKDATISFAEKSLIIGANEIGKSNLLYALRILLDPTIADADLIPQDSDFYAFEATDLISISLKFRDVKEDCVLAKFAEHVSDTGDLYLRYEGRRNAVTGEKSYNFQVGKDVDSLQIHENRFYLRVLNLKFMDSRRDLTSFMRREKRNLIQDAKKTRGADQVKADNATIKEVENSLQTARSKISSISYISRATAELNEELEMLSYQNRTAQVVFDTGTADTEQFIDDLKLASNLDGKTLAIGGDGKNNQIQLALWAARNNASKKTSEEPLEVNIFCIEEPEAHLHPHQQRKLATYLSDTLQAQVILTTHSPQIACEFPTSSLIRLYNHAPDTQAACSVCSPHIESAFVDFGYRLNVIPAEAFFANIVLLVEGRSEELFYKALARAIDIDLDRLNISIVMVDGVGFSPYASLFNALNIGFVMRTDNDVFKVPRTTGYRLAGIERGIEVCRKFRTQSQGFLDLLSEATHLRGFPSESPPIETQKIAVKFEKILAEHDIFLAKLDLEHDLYDAMNSVVSDYLQIFDRQECIEEMQKQKATFMYEFLRNDNKSLATLRASNLAKPLVRCKEIVENVYGAKSD